MTDETQTDEKDPFLPQTVYNAGHAMETVTRYLERKVIDCEAFIRLESLRGAADQGSIAAARAIQTFAGHALLDFKRILVFAPGAAPTPPQYPEEEQVADENIAAEVGLFASDGGAGEANAVGVAPPAPTVETGPEGSAGLGPDSPVSESVNTTVSSIPMDTSDIPSTVPETGATEESFEDFVEASHQGLAVSGATGEPTENPSGRSQAGPSYTVDREDGEVRELNDGQFNP